ncbi:hypothetical protein D3X11_04245 [Streptococcus sp. X16XC17]|uniref:hypothetical protein n=1 Tax=unclassified Streptococcus TaxID=2608887 RepID=UPI0009E9A280|nr:MULTISPECIES: hypothetical protein [unclassified Streptococcus]TCD46601.1 hypothetical protein D3X11_04245 [Streptococcus sp. X16XC17]
MNENIRKKRKGGTLSMVVVMMVIVTATVALMAGVLSTANRQTLRNYHYLDAKYVATSGSQLSLGAFFEGDGKTSDLYTEFSKRANRQKTSEEKATATHQFEHGTAKITMTGEFSPKDSKSKNDYYVTVTSHGSF